MITIYDIAKDVGVSSTTVSRALNNHGDVKDSTKRKIFAAADRLGYLPNAQAKALTMKKSWNIGLLLSDDANEGLKHTLFAGIVESISKVSAINGYDITFMTGNLGVNTLSYLDHVKYRMFDGIIIASSKVYDESIKELIKEVPHVAVIDQLIDDCLCVNSLNREGMRISITHLVDRGYENIVYIHAQNNNYVAQERISSFKSITKDLEIYDKCKLIEGRFTDPHRAYELTRILIESDSLPDAIIYCDDYSAGGGLKCLLENGIKIPEEVAIMGYDGIELSQMLTPRITTILQDVDLIGETVTKELINSIEKKEIGSKIIELPVKLLKGETT